MSRKRIISLGIVIIMLITMIPAGAMTAFAKSIINDESTIWVEAENYDRSRGGKILSSASASGGAYIGDFLEGHWMGYDLQVEKAGFYEVKIRAASNGDHIYTKISNDGLEDSGDIPATGGWQTYKDVTLKIWLGAGYNFFRVYNMGGTWNLDRIDFTYISSDLSGINIAELGFVAASSGSADALTSNEGRWIADGGAGEHAIFRFKQGYALDSLVLNNPAENAITSATLVFSDGTNMPVELTEGENTINLDGKISHWVLLEVDAVAEGVSQAGLDSMEIYGSYDEANTLGIDTGPDGFITNSGRFETTTDVLKGITVTDGKVGFLWMNNHKVEKVHFYALPEMDSAPNVTVTFGDGTTYETTMVLEENGGGTVSFPLTITDEMYVEIEGLSDFSCKAVQALGPGEIVVLGSAYSSVYIHNRWKNQRLVEQDNKIIYGANSTAQEAAWSLLPTEDGYFSIRNDVTGNYITLTADDSTLSCLPNGNETNAGLWNLVASGNYYLLYNVQYPDRALNVENQTGYVEAGSIQPTWYSAMFTLPAAEADIAPEDYTYTIKDNTVEDTMGRAVAYNDKMIITDSYGSNKMWTLEEDISDMPQFQSSTTIADAVYNLSQAELKENQMDSSKYPGNVVFNTGTNWGKVWTRDTAMSIHYSLAWLYPDESYNCIIEKIIENPDVFEQDTGTGGSYPVSVDKIIMAIATWEQYLTSGDDEFLDYIYDVAANTIEQDDHLVWDEKYGLYRGETGGLDHRDKTYPDWMSEIYQDSIINIAESYSSIVNIIYAETMNILSQAAIILDRGEEESQMWADRRDQLIESIDEYFWMENRGMYSSFLYPDYMGAPMADKVDVISNGYALVFGIADDEKAEQILENYPLVTYGAPTVWPQKNGRQANTIYHNRGVWPGWEPALMMGAKVRGNSEMADEIWRSCIRGAAMHLTNKEVINFTTGAGVASDNQLWSIAGTVSGYYRVLYGMVYTVDGITFDPYIPDWMDGPFEITNYQYRDSVLTLKLSGKGDTLVSIKVDGVEQDLDYVFPTDMAGEHTIEMVVEDSGHRSPVNITPMSWVACPDLPVLNYNASTNTLSWTPVDGLSYKLWNGSRYIDVTGQSTYQAVDGRYAVYSLVSVDANGITSEMAKPVIINDESNIIKIEAEDGEYKAGNFSNAAGTDNKYTGYSGTGYVTDIRNNPTEMTITVDVPQGKAGNYVFYSIYGNKGNGTTTTNCGIRSVYLDGEDVGTMIMPLNNFNWERSNFLNIYLTSGTHTITMKYDDANWYDRSMNVSSTSNSVVYDYFQLEYLDSTSSVNKRILKATIDYAEEQDITYLNKLVKEKYLAALEEAIRIYDDPNAIQSEVDQAAQDLLEMIHMLDYISDSRALQLLVEMAEELDMDLYKNGTAKDDFLDALANAIDVLEEITSLNEDYDAAYDLLKEAMDALELKEILDPTQLQKMIDRAKDIVDNQSKYIINDKWSTFIDKLANAEAALAVAETQQELDDAADALYSAILDLRLTPNKDLLKDLLNTSGKVDAKLYSIESITVLNIARTTGLETYSNPQATQEDVNKAAKGIKSAMENLEPVKVSGSGANTNTEDTEATDKETAAKGAKTVASPRTGDNSFVPLILVLSAFSGLAMAFTKKRKTKK